MQDEGHREITRREFIRKCAAIGIALPALPLVLEACGSTKGNLPVSPGSTPSPGSTVRPASNQELTIGVPKDEYVASGLKSYVGMYPLNANIYEPLVRLDPDYSISPQLATAWKQVGANTVRFHLRPGVTFHDGSAFGATDVKYTFDRIASGGGGLVGLGPSSTVVVDNLTVDVTPMAPNLRLVEQVVHPEYSILKAGTVPGVKGPGTGPFRWVSYVPQSKVVVKANPTYWGDKAKASGLTFEFIPDATSRGLALAAGQLDVAAQLARPSVASLKTRQGVDIVSAPVGAYSAMYVNIHGKAPYTIGADPAVRLALQTGIDRHALIQSVFNGLADPGHTLLPAPLLGSSASLIKGFSYDPARAKASLDSAGWKVGSGGIRSRNGKSLRLVLINGFPDAAANAGVPEFVQASLHGIGIDVTIKSEPDSNSYSAVLGKGAGDLFLETGSQNDANPAFLPEVLFYGKPPSQYSKLFDPGPSFDAAISAALAATSTAAVDRDVAQAIHQVEDVAMVFIELAGIFLIFGLRSDIHGLVPNPSDVNQSWASVYRGG